MATTHGESWVDKCLDSASEGSWNWGHNFYLVLAILEDVSERMSSTSTSIL